MENIFLNMIQRLRSYEEVLLYANIIEISPQDERQTLAFLEEEYNSESTHYPFTAPPFDASAALWAARTVYTAAQLMLYRRNPEAALAFLLPEYTQVITPAALLSADICLRFVPHIITHLRMADPEDVMIGILEQHLHSWHYSAIGYLAFESEPALGVVCADECLQQMYADRVMERSDTYLAALPPIAEVINASVGMFARELYNNSRP